MITSNKSTHLIVGKRISRTASLAGTQVSRSSIADGEVVVTDAAGKILDTTTVLTAKEVVIVQGQGATKPLIKSDVIKKGTVVSYKGKKYVPAVEQVSFIGYNGSSGSIDAINSNDYFGRILMQGEQNTHGNRDMYINFYAESDSATTQAEVAEELAESLALNKEWKGIDKFIKVEQLTSENATVTATTVATGTLTFTKGSKTISASVAIDGDGLAAGVWLRVGTAVTDPVYKIVSINTSAETAELNIPFQGTSTTKAAAAAEFITAVTAASANFGLKITGVAKTYIPGIFRYYKNRFKILLKDFGTTTLTEPGTSPAVGANEGSGTTEQVQELEWFMQGNHGKIYRIDPSIPVSPIANVVDYLGSDVGFAQITISHYDATPAAIGDTQKSHKSVIIAAPESATSTSSVGTNFDGAVTSVSDVLDAFFNLAANGSHTALTNTWYNA